MNSTDVFNADYVRYKCRYDKKSDQWHKRISEQYGYNSINPSFYKVLTQCLMNDYYMSSPVCLIPKSII